MTSSHRACEAHLMKPRTELLASPKRLVVAVALSALLLVDCDSNEPQHTTANPTAKPPSANELASKKPSAKKSAATSTCPIRSYRYARFPTGKCYLEPLTKAKPGQMCDSSLSERPCPPALTDRGFILIDENKKCTVTLATAGTRKTRAIPCPRELLAAAATLSPSPAPSK